MENFSLVYSLENIIRKGCLGNSFTQIISFLDCFGRPKGKKNAEKCPF